MSCDVFSRHALSWYVCIFARWVLRCSYVFRCSFMVLSNEIVEYVYKYTFHCLYWRNNSLFCTYEAAPRLEGKKRGYSEYPQRKFSKSSRNPLGKRECNERVGLSSLHAGAAKEEKCQEYSGAYSEETLKGGGYSAYLLEIPPVWEQPKGKCSEKRKEQTPFN